MADTKITPEDVKHLAALSNLKVDENETSNLTKQLEETIEYVKNLKELDTKTSGIYRPVTGENVEFEDGTPNHRKLTQDEALANSKSRKGNYFVVKRIM